MIGGDGEIERAFNQKFIPDSYELINVYKLYDVDLLVEDYLLEVNAQAAAASAAEENKAQQAATSNEDSSTTANELVNNVSENIGAQLLQLDDGQEEESQSCSSSSNVQQEK